MKPKKWKDEARGVESHGRGRSMTDQRARGMKAEPMGLRAEVESRAQWLAGGGDRGSSHQDGAGHWKARDESEHPDGTD